MNNNDDFYFKYLTIRSPVHVYLEDPQCLIDVPKDSLPGA